MPLHHNISGELTQELFAAGKYLKVSLISLVNTHASTTCLVDIYVEKKLTGKFYIVKSLPLAVGASAILKDVSLRPGEFGLYIKLSKSDVFTLTGTIDPIADPTVTGVGTLFLTEVQVGDEIIVSGETRTVASIASNTELEVTVATTNTSNDTTPDCSPKPNVDVIIN
mgnify:CR=1 FL=1